MVPDIISQYYKGENIGGERRVRFIRIEAIDINIAFDKWLLVVTTYGVVRMDLDELLPGVNIPHAIKRRMNPDFGALWKSEKDSVEIEQPMWTDSSVRAAVLEAVQ